MVLVAVFVVIVAAEHVAQPRLTPANYMVSEYARARGLAGSAAVVGFACWSASLFLSSGALLAGCTRDRAATRVVAVLLVVAAIGMAATAGFRTQAVRGSVPHGVVRTAAGELHDLGTGVAELALFAAALATAVLWAPRRPLRAVSVAAVVLAVGLGPVLSLADATERGLRQRLLIAVACVWQITLLDVVRRPRCDDFAEGISPRSRNSHTSYLPRK